jgi:serine/threonine protein kinase
MPTSRPAKALAATELAVDSSGQGASAPSGVSIRLEAGDPSRPGTLPPGTLIAERYRIDEVLGEGGMGKVYAAEHVHMHKQVAIKVLHPEMSTAPEVVARFEREAVAAGKITHPNVAAATDFGRLSDSSFFLVLERVVGTDLRAVIRDGPVEPERALHIIQQITAAVGSAHAAGVVHRDLKPENIMLVLRDGDPDFVKVLDFGIAKIDSLGIEGAGPRSADGHAASAPLTRMGAVFGTPDYMSPEQALGQTVDLRSDLYSVGVIFFELLVGARPFRGGAVTLMRAHVLDAVPTLPPEVLAAVGPGYDAVIQKLLQKSASDRYSSAQELLEALDAIAPGPLVSPLAPSGDGPGSAIIALTAGPEPSPAIGTDDTVSVRNPPRRRRAFGPLSFLVILGALGAGAYDLVVSPERAGALLQDAVGATVATPTASPPSQGAAAPALDTTEAPQVLDTPPPTDPDDTAAAPDDPRAPAPAGVSRAGAHFSQSRPAGKPLHKTNKGAPPAKHPLIPPPSQWFKN